MTETLLNLYETHDGYVSDKWSSYLAVYEELFAPLRDKPVRLLEIGVQNGGSLQIWSKYFRNATAIVGCDINPGIAKLKPGPKVHLVVGDIASPATAADIRRISSTYDIVIDDGSHRSDHIIAAFRQIFPMLAPGGLFVAEDLIYSYRHSFKGRIFAPFSSVEFFKRLVEAINYDHWRNRPREMLLSRVLAPLSVHRLKRLTVSELHQQIRSVRFYNSICIIERTGGGAGIGDRIIAGQTALVDDGVFRLPNARRYGAFAVR